jgi:hypothetical protein
MSSTEKVSELTRKGFSFELIAPKSEAKLNELWMQLNSILDLNPLFCSVAMHDFESCVQSHPFCSLTFAGKLLLSVYRST